MPWPIRFLENPPLRPPHGESRFYDGTVDFDKFAVGDMAYYHFQGKPCTDREHLLVMHLTAHYFTHNIGRPPLILALPDRAAPNGKLYFTVDGQCYSNKCVKCNQSKNCKCDERQPRGYYDGWTVTGAVPLITVAPSINYDDEEYGIKHYHGHVQNGIIGDG